MKIFKYKVEKNVIIPFLILFMTRGIITFAQCGINASNDTSVICGSSVQFSTKAKWLPIYNANGNMLHCVFFTSANTGYVAGSNATNGIILKTTDGGTNWSQQIITTMFSLRSVYFVNANTGYAVGNDSIGGGHIMKTIDGGGIWTLQTNATIQGLNSVYFSNADTGYTVGNSGVILKTTNGGANWATQTSGTTLILSSVYFTTADTGYAVGMGLIGNGAKILKTCNGGANWITQNSGTSGITDGLFSVHFTDANTGYAVGGNGAIVKTINGGTNWVIQPTGTLNGLHSINFIDANTAFANGDYGTILKTIDAGANWTTQISGTTDYFSSIFFTDLNTGYIASVNNKIFKYSEPISYSWFPTNGLNDANVSSPIANPTATTTYVVTASTANGCSSKDTVNVFVNPLIANAGLDKTIICGGAVLLDSIISNYSGTGYLTYNWTPSTGLNNDSIPNPTTTITNDTIYFVTITTPNGCTAIDSISIIVNPLTITGTNGTIFCGDSTTLNTSNNYSGTDSLTYSWFPATGLDNATIANPFASADSNQTYTVTLTTTNGCIATTDVNVTLIPMNATEICIVGVDSTNKNRIVWNKPISSAIDSFYIYRETNITNIYQKTGAVSYDSLSVFVDVNSFPDVQSNKYKISVKDDCGLESNLSTAHKTMHLAINQGMGSTWNLIWDPYEGFTVSTYNVYRGTTSNNLQLLGTSSGSNTQYSDLTAPSGDLYYQVEVVSPNSCTPSRSYNSSRSNIASNSPNGIHEIMNEAELFSIYPNPASSKIMITNNGKMSDETYLSICNIRGEQIMDEKFQNKNRMELDISLLSNGIYFVKMRTEKKVAVKKFIKQ